MSQPAVVSKWAHGLNCQCIGCRHDRALAQTKKGHPPRPKPGGQARYTAPDPLVSVTRYCTKCGLASAKPYCGAC